jgi:light-regulated signal transduction histidine kinase (bacteriophytochrome)
MAKSNFMEDDSTTILPSTSSLLDKVAYATAIASRNYVGVFSDFAARKSGQRELKRRCDGLEQRVAELTRELQAANRELEAYSLSVSQDLRAPLRAIHGFSSMLEKDYSNSLDDQGKDYLHRVCAASERMALLIDDLLKLGCLWRQPLRTDRANLSAMAGVIAEELQAGEPTRNVDWVIAPDLKTTGDPGLLKVVLENLLGNAWKYSSTRPSARIEFGVADEGGRCVYFVRDNGVGFDMAYSEKLFTAFQRLHSESEFPGTGIGLATVARIIHRHGGGIWGEGRVGEGATFRFALCGGRRWSTNRRAVTGFHVSDDNQTG